MNFEEKVKSLTAYEIIMAMVKGLEKPKIRVNMSTYGNIVYKPIFGLFDVPICYGCAATNTICQISGIKFNSKNIELRSERADALNTDKDFLQEFEDSIDFLRCGELKEYNVIARRYGFAEIKYTDELQKSLPILNNDYTAEDLRNYKILAVFTNEISDTNNEIRR